MSPTSKINGIFMNNDLLYLNINECNKHFPGVGSQFSYYCIRKNNTENLETTIVCKYKNNVYNTTSVINHRFLPMLLGKESLSIIDKFYNNDLEKVSFKKNCTIHS